VHAGALWGGVERAIFLAAPLLCGH
jgi:hypothetical protein